jgi:hypothetical protein
LGIRDQLRSSLQKDSPQRKRGIWHSKAYHRFFEGYSESTIPTPNGKGYRIQRVYTGNTYRQDLTTGQRVLLRVLYVGLFMCAVYLFVSSAVLPLTSNSTWYVTLPQAVSLPFMFWIVSAFGAYLPAEREMTIHGYRSSSLALQKATLGAAICLGLTALATLAFTILNPTDEPLRVLGCALRFFTGGLISLGMNWIERKVNYSTIPSQNRPPEDNIEII